MPEIIDHVTYLSQEIGPRPAGTEEEHQASQYIAEYLEKNASLPTEVEEFNAPAAAGLPLLVCSGVSILVAIFALILGILAWPAFVLSLAAAVIAVLEEMGRPIISRFFSKGISQNVVAKYVPAAGQQSRRKRKVIVVARYDTGKVAGYLNGPLLNALPIIKRASFAGLAVMPILMLIRALFFSQGGGLIFTILTVVAIVLVAIPIVFFVMRQIAAFNEGANSNASGVAVLLDVADRVSNEGEQDWFQEVAPVVHGQEAAEAAGVVDEGVELDYQIPALDDLDVEAPEMPEPTSSERLSAAKAAIAAMTGRPTAPQYNENLSSNLVQVSEENTEPLEGFAEEQDSLGESDGVDAAGIAGAAAATAAAATTLAAMNAQSARANDNVPDWYRQAQEQASRPRSSQPVKRSRYADALDSAVAESSNYFQAANQSAVSPLDWQIQKLNEQSIHEVPAPAETLVEPAVPAEEPVAEQPVAEAPKPTRGRGVDAIFDTPAVTPQAEQLEAIREIEVAPVELAQAPVEPAPAPVVDLPAIQPRPELLEQDAATASSARSVLAALAPIGATGSLPTVSRRRPSVKEPGADQLRSMLPSLSGILQPVKAEPAQVEEPLADELPGNDELGATQMFVPVADDAGAEQPVKDCSETDEFVADEPLYDEEYEAAEAQARAAASPVFEDVPTKRGLFGKLFGGGKREGKSSRRAVREESVSEWLNVDEDFEARSAGARRSWRSFNEGQDQGGRWNGGAFSRLRLGRADTLSSPNSDNAAMGVEPEAEDAAYLVPSEMVQEQASAPSMDTFAKVAQLAAARAAASGHATESELQAAELQQIHQFHNAALTTEVWFVALGSELADHAGMKAFMKEHADELRGAVVLELDSLGAGDLSLVTEEGALIPTQTSSRMKRYLRKAQQATGLTAGTAKMLWTTGSAAFAAQQGGQAMHLAGMDGIKPAGMGEADDILDRVDADLLTQRSDFVYQILKNI